MPSKLTQNPKTPFGSQYERPRGRQKQFKQPYYVPTGKIVVSRKNRILMAYTPKEDAAILKHYPKKNWRALYLVLDSSIRTQGAVRARYSYLNRVINNRRKGINTASQKGKDKRKPKIKRTPWSKEDDLLILRHYGNIPAKQIAVLLSTLRSIRSIQIRAKTLFDRYKR